MGRGQHADGFPAGFVDDAEKVVTRMGLPHYLLAAAVLVLSTLLPNVFGGGAGPVGPAGPSGRPAVSTPIGVCIYFGPDKNGHKRLQLSESAANESCTKGWYLSLKPKS